MKRSVKLYREKGTRGFSAPRATRGAAVLVDGVVEKVGVWPRLPNRSI
jgi:hypothetical protein